jgi:hypothetical protein
VMSTSKRRETDIVRHQNLALLSHSRVHFEKTTGRH